MRILDKVFINGEFIAPHGTETMELKNPASGELITKVVLADEVDTRQAIIAARNAFKTYSTASLETRGEYLQRIHDAMLARRGDLLAVLNQEYGAPQWFAAFALDDAIRSWLVAKEQLKPETCR